MTASIRRATPTDTDALAALENAAFQGDRISRRSFRRLFLTRTADVLVAEQAGSVVGYAVVLYRAGSAVARLYSLARCAQATSMGVGRLLLAAAEESARARGSTILRLEVREDNRRAVGLYESSGYRSFGRRESYYEDGAAALRYQKDLCGAQSAADTHGECQPS